MPPPPLHMLQLNSIGTKHLSSEKSCCGSRQIRPLRHHYLVGSVRGMPQSFFASSCPHDSHWFQWFKIPCSIYVYLMLFLFEWNMKTRLCPSSSLSTWSNSLLLSSTHSWVKIRENNKRLKLGIVWYCPDDLQPRPMHRCWLVGQRTHFAGI